MRTPMSAHRGELDYGAERLGNVPRSRKTVQVEHILAARVKETHLRHHETTVHILMGHERALDIRMLFHGEQRKSVRPQGKVKGSPRSVDVTVVACCRKVHSVPVQGRVSSGIGRPGAR